MKIYEVIIKVPTEISVLHKVNGSQGILALKVIMVIYGEPERRLEGQ
jgi:hypothetical protein